MRDVRPCEPLAPRIRRYALRRVRVYADAANEASRDYE